MSSCDICHVDDETIVKCNGIDYNHHLYCVGCIENYLRHTKYNKRLIDYWKLNRALQCSLCDSKISDDLLLNSQLNKLYRDIIIDITLSIAFNERVVISEEKTDSDKILEKIRDTITTCIRCPYFECSRPFYDFNGCLALTCHFCNGHFCGYCLKEHLQEPERVRSQSQSQDMHNIVKSHTTKISKYMFKEYGFTGHYFISQEGWKKWKERIQIDAIYQLLLSIGSDVLWKTHNEIINVMKIEELLTDRSIEMLNKLIFYSGQEHYRKATKIQKFVRGSLYRLHRLPLVMYQIQKYLISSERATLVTLKDKLNNRIKIMDKSVNSMWFDILVNDYHYAWIPVSIFHTDMRTCAFVGKIPMYVHCYTDHNIDILNGSCEYWKMNEILLDKLKSRKYNKSLKKDNYIVAINTNNHNDVIVNSVKGLRKLTYNPNSFLGISIKWNENREYYYEPVKYKIEQFRGCMMKRFSVFRNSIVRRIM